MDRIPTEDYFVVNISGQSGNIPQEHDILADRIIEGWRFSRANVAVPHHKQAVPDSGFLHKHKFETWRETDGLYGKVLLEIDNREIKLDSGPIRNSKPMAKGSEHMIFTIEGERLEAITMECKPIPDPSKLPGEQSQPSSRDPNAWYFRPPEESLADYLLANDKKTAKKPATPTNRPTKKTDPTEKQTQQPTEKKGNEQQMNTQPTGMVASQRQQLIISTVIAEALARFPDCSLECLDNSSNRDREVTKVRQIVAHILKHWYTIPGTLIQRRLAPEAKNSGAIYNAAARGQELQQDPTISNKINEIRAAVDAKIGPDTADSGSGGGGSEDIVPKPTSEANGSKRRPRTPQLPKTRHLQHTKKTGNGASHSLPSTALASDYATSIKHAVIFALWLQEHEPRSIASAFDIPVRDVNLIVVHMSGELGKEADEVACAIQSVVHNV